jgi:hypothetical protein
MNIPKLSIWILIIFFSSCFQETEIFIPKNSPEDPALLYKDPVIKPTRFVLPIEQSVYYFTTDNKSVLKIPYGSLLTENGQYFTGNAILEIIETHSIGDHVLLGKSPLSGNQPLNSHWLLYFTFTADGKTLNINPDIPVEWHTNINSDENHFRLYKEVSSENNIKSWVKNADGTLLDWAIDQNDNIIKGSGCMFRLYETGWFMIANPVTPDQNNSSKVCVAASGQFHHGNSLFFAFVKSRNILIPLAEKNEQGYYCFPDFQLDRNSGIKFVLISYQSDGKYYFAEKDTYLAAEEITTLEPKPRKFEDIIQRIKGL